MALIEITVDNPSLINTGEGDASREAADEGGESSLGLSSGRTESEGDADTDLIGTVGTFVTALSALAGVLRQLRSEETEGAEAEAEGGLSLTDEDTDDEPIIGDAEEDEVGDELDETEDEALETGLEGEDTVEESSGSGLGTKVAVLLVIVLVVAVLWSRSGDEDPEFEEFDA